MTATPPTARTFRFSKLLRDALRGEAFSPGSRLHIARPLDAESLVGRHEGRGRGGAKSISSKLQQRIGSSRKTARALGKAGTFKFDPRQRAIVKVHYFSHAGGGGAALSAHAGYVARDASARMPGDETPAVAEPDAVGEPGAQSQAQAHAHYLQRGAEQSLFYDNVTGGVDGAGRAARWAREDRRHFRLIVSAENGGRLGDLRSYTREVMRRAEAALATGLEWIAVDHWDTDNPHTHIILRGRTEDGRDLVIPREFVSHGFRSAAQDVATERLGPRSRDDTRLALARQARTHGPTWLDRIIAGQLDERGRVRVADFQAPDRSPELTDALKARAHELKRLGLASETGRNNFQFEAGWQDALKAMELHLDVRKALLRARTQDVSSRLNLAKGPHPTGRDR